MSTSDKNKGGQKAWTTNEQKDWLTNRLPSYVASRASDSPSDFWAGVFEGWFENWPISGADEGDAAAKSSEEQAKKKKAVSDVQHPTIQALTEFLPLANQGLV